MKKSVKIILSIIAIILVVVLYFMFFHRARTFYTGYVSIETIPLADIAENLEKRGCNSPSRQSGGSDDSLRYCTYDLVNRNNENAINVSPRGIGFGPRSFTLTTTKLYTSKDIAGFPWTNKFKEEVRQDIADTGNFIKIKENSWEITEIKYPITRVY
ncbi:hypothetical protein HYW73_03145 [Candidatus Nomurabacteria bacterium]|nr:hypothetical protein [Candidatus Nomurabacteria bacterium]